MWLFENKLIAVFLVISITLTVFLVWAGPYKAGDVLLRLCLAYIASFIFYIVAVIVPRKKDQQKIRKLIRPRIQSIIESANWVFFELSAENKNVFNRRTITIENLKELCKRVDPKGLSLGALDPDWRRPTVREVLVRNKANSVGDIHQVLALSVYLDMTLIELLIQIIECQYFLTCQHVLEHIGDFRGTGLEFLAPAFFSYFQIINELEDYRNKHFNSSAEKEREKYLFAG